MNDERLERGPVLTQDALTPPVTAFLGTTLKPDYNYDTLRSDREVDEEARLRPHGYIRPNSSGLKAKCGGELRCGVCHRERELLEAGDVD